MRSTGMYACIAAAVALTACADPADPLSVDEVTAPGEALGFGKRIVYVVDTLPSLGGPTAHGRSITARGWVAGYSHLPGNQTMEAVVWRGGELIELRTLGGPSSSVLWPGQNQRGTVVGISETDEMDPLGENFSCVRFFPSFPEHSGRTCVGFIWEGGEMRPIPTLGGHNGFATGVNNRGQVVGWAETEVRDPTCNTEFQTLQFRGFVWDSRRDRITELPPLPGDSSSTGNAINDRGQVVGISGACADAFGASSARRAVLWDRGQIIDLGTLGADEWNTPMYISLRGDVVGFAGSAPDQGGPFPLQPFIWTRRGGMQPLDRVEGCAGGQAHAINLRRQVVGVATGCEDGQNRAFLWENGTTTDLNEHLAPGTDVFLADAREINVRGQITGRAVDPETRDSVAFVATPRPRGWLLKGKP